MGRMVLLASLGFCKLRNSRSWSSTFESSVHRSRLILVFHDTPSVCTFHLGCDSYVVSLVLALDNCHKTCGFSPWSLSLHEEGCPLTQQCLSSTGQSIPQSSAGFFSPHSGHSFEIGTTTMALFQGTSDYIIKMLG